MSLLHTLRPPTLQALRACLVLGALLLRGTGCADPDPPPAAAPAPPAAPAPAAPGTPAPAAATTPAAEPGPAALRTAADAVVAALAAGDLPALADRVHPRAGVRFSPYAWVEPESHVTLSAEALRAAAAGEPVRRTWGHYDGSGEPIVLDLGEYLDRFVYDRPYERGRVAVDRRQGHGNTLDNAAEVYPGARVVEYHLPGEDPRFGGMDWRSLRLVFVDEDGRWLLVGIVHDEWTI